VNTNTQSMSASQKMLRNPFIRIVLASFVVLIPIIVEQFLVTSLPISKLWKNILLGIFTLPIAYWTYYAYVHFIERRDLTELASTGALKETSQGVLAGFLLFSGTIAILTLLGAYKMTGVNGWEVLLIPFIGSAISGLFEEILFRGILFRIIEESLGSWLALLISAIIFGLLHLLGENATWLGALSVMFEAGILLAAAYMLTRRLWFAIGIHFAWDFTQSGIFGIAVSGNKALPGLFKSSLAGPSWLTGGAFGAEASLAAVVLCVAAGIYFIVRAVKKEHIIRPYWRRSDKA